MLWIGSFLVLVLVSTVLLSLFFRQFHRDPERAIPDGNVIVSPADGEVLEIIQVTPGQIVDLPKGILGRVRAFTSDLSEEVHLIIPIFMNPFNVHVQRAPLEGKVLNVKHHPGKFLMANSLAAFQNETVETLFETPVGRIKVLQTSGLLVRNIRNWLEPGQTVEKGERFGKIDFGSQVTLILPKSVIKSLQVKRGDKVLGGETVLAIRNE